ncbi:MAG: hypothetical protein ABEH88_10960 [Halobacteriales archaeon]
MTCNQPYDRGVSTVLAYVLGLAIVTALISGLLVTTTGIVSQERERAAEAELRVLGNSLAADVTTVDRLAFSADDARVRLTRDLPNTVAGSSYRMRLEHDESGPTVIELVAADPDVSVTVPVTNGTAVGNSTASGGDVSVRYDGNAVVIEDE